MSLKEPHKQKNINKNSGPFTISLAHLYPKIKNEVYPQMITLKFKGTFEYLVNDGKKAAPFYTIGRPGKNGISDATIIIDGICPQKNSIEIRDNTNSKVEFLNCK